MQRLYTYFKPGYIVTFCVLLFTGYFSFLSLSRHDNFYSRRLDLGNMDQTVWNVANGNGFTLTDPMGENQQSRLAIHADFLLILLAPLYFVWSDPQLLLLIQVVFTAAGAFPVYWLACRVNKSKWVPVLFAAGYLLYPPLNRVMLHDFHAVVLSTPFLLFAFWFLETKKYPLFILFALLAGLGKEDVWLVISLLGIYLTVQKKQYLLGSLVAIASFAVFYYLFWIAIPAVAPANQHFALSYLSDFGTNQNGILKNILMNPFSVLATLFKTDRLMYYFQLLAPFTFLSLFSPITLLLGLPSLLINSLSNNPMLRQIDYQYTATITPFVCISAVYGFNVFQELLRKYFQKIHFKHAKIFPIYLLVFSTLISVYFWGQMPIGKSQWFWFFIRPLPEKQIMKEVEAQIGSSYSVSATNNIGSHFSQRKYLYNFPIRAQEADFTVVYLGDPYAWPGGPEQQQMVDRMLKDPNYGIIASEGNFFAFRRIGL